MLIIQYSFLFRATSRTMVPEQTQGSSMQKISPSPSVDLSGPYSTFLNHHQQDTSKHLLRLLENIWFQKLPPSQQHSRDCAILMDFHRGILWPEREEADGGDHQPYLRTLAKSILDSGEALWASEYADRGLHRWFWLVYVPCVRWCRRDSLKTTGLVHVKWR